MTIRAYLLAVAVFCAALSVAGASVSVNALFSNNMVIQRNKVVPVFGTASPSESVSVTFNGQTKSTTADAQGDWKVYLSAMGANSTAQTMTITGTNTITITGVLVGDVWLISGQSNMTMPLSASGRKTQDEDTANFPGIRRFYRGGTVDSSAYPTKNLSGSSWIVCSPSTAGSFPATGFYYARKIYQDQAGLVPIGLLECARGSTDIDTWVCPEAIANIPLLTPLLDPAKARTAFGYFNSMVYPMEPYGICGVIWWQGCSREISNQSIDSYYVKERAIVQGWRQLWGGEEFPFYIVQLANYEAAAVGPTPDLAATHRNDTRVQQTNVLYGLPRTGMAVAIDVGDADNIHPPDKLDIGERLALWALKNDYGRTNIVESGPILKDVVAGTGKLVCSFYYVGSGLMVGSKTQYQPTQEVPNGTLARFSIAGSDGVWRDGNAVIVGDTVEVSSTSVPFPTKVAYAHWPNPTGCNLYNKEGLPASPFYVDDVNAKYAITASVGTGGTISPAGATTYLKRRTALYTITPDPGYYIQDVKVDNVSVGAVSRYSFDPLYANHTISATFAQTQPTYTITASASAGGSLSQSGTLTVAQGGSQAFKIIPNAGSYVDIVTVDGVPVGNRGTFTFSAVRANHTISASFKCKITATVGYGGAIIPAETTDIPYGTSKTFTITPNPGFTTTNVKVDGADQGAIASYTFTNVTGPHTISATFSGGGGTQDGIPRIYDLLFSVDTDSLPASGNITSWASYIPSGKTLSKIGTPTVEVINGAKWAKIEYSAYEGFNYGTYANSIVSNGVSMVMAIRPVRDTANSIPGYGPAIFNDRMVLGIKSNTGQVFVRRNGTTIYSTATIPDGQVTILSMVAQPNGTFKVWANGAQIMNDTSTSDITTMSPSGNNNTVTLGASSNTGAYTFNGDIGDTFVYLVPLSDADRQQLESNLTAKFASGTTTTYTITTSAGTGGSINPSGPLVVNEGASKTFTITPLGGYVVANVIVDGVSQGAITSYTFNGVTANHSISATFTAVPTSTITAYAGTGGTISPVGAVLVNSGSNQTFTITPSVGYTIADVSVDNVSVGAVTSYTFNNVTTAHTISATFSALPPLTISASAEAGGTISPSGSVSVSYGANQAFTFTPNVGYVLTDVEVDDDSIGAVGTYTFNNVTANHIIYARFAPAPPLTITASAGSGGSISPSGAVSVQFGADQAFAITPNTDYAISDVLVDNVSVGMVNTYTFSKVSANHTIAATFSSGGIPRTDQLYGSWITNSLPASGVISTWASAQPTGLTLAKMGSPTVSTINGVKWASHHYSTSDGMDMGPLGSTASPSSIPCNGASVVMAVRPVRYGTKTDWIGCFSVFTYTLSVGIRNDTGNICARRNNTLFSYPSAIIPDGQITILSLVVQPNGSFKIYANGTQVVNETATSPFTEMAQTWSGSDNGRHITIGRAYPAGWSCFNGDIGDTYFYKVALTDTERQQLEAVLSGKFLPPAYQDVASIAALKAKSDGAPVRLTGSKTVIYAPKNAVGTRTDKFFYIGEEQSLGGLKVVDKTSDALSVGNQVTNLTGYVRKPANGEVYLELTADVTGAGNTPIKPIGINNKSALTDAKALTNTVRVFGKVKSVNLPTSFTISDGFDTNGITVMINGVPYTGTLDTTNTVVVTGLLTTDNTGKVIVHAQEIGVL